MERDAETVRFVADVHQHFERLAVAVDVIRHRIVRKVDLFDPLGQPDDRNLLLQPQSLQRFISKPQLSFSPVHDDQLRQFGSLFQQAAVTPRHHLFHRREIVGPDHRFDVEMTVFFTRGFTVAEYDA